MARGFVFGDRHVATVDVKAQVKRDESTFRNHLVTQHDRSGECVVPEALIGRALAAP